jgi:hypothetical protein
MLHSLLRSLKVRQIGQTQLHISVDGAAVTPEAAGPDKAFVASVEDKGTGYYKITLKEKAKSPLHISSLVSGTDKIILKAHLVGEDFVEIKAWNDAGVATDAAFNIQIQFFDQLSYFF